MGVSQSQHNYGPSYKSAVVEIKKRQTSKVVEEDPDEEEEQEEDSEPLLAHEKAQDEEDKANAAPFPYTKTRLRELPYKDIIKRGLPWNDPTFPHGPQALFIDGDRHQSHEYWDYVDEQRFYWRRASDHFADQGCKTLVFDGIDPTDIVQGKIADCYFLAALAGLAEDAPEKAHLQLGERIRDNFLVQKANKAGCYAIRMTVDGEERVVVVDDWFPFYLDKEGNEKFCFARNKSGELRDGEGEMWVQLIEKAWAKVCGSYEAAEMGTAAEALNNIDGTPCQIFIVDQIETANGQAELWDLLEEADRERYVVTCSVDSNVRSNPDTLKEFGLCDFHSYTMMQCLAVKLHEKGKTYRYLIQLRNPWGKREWLGPWSDYSNTWDKYPYVHKQLRIREDKSQRSQASTGTLGAADDGRFWMLYKDFFQYFYCVTINYTRDDFHLIRIADEVPDETWGVSRVVFPQPTESVFISIFQMNQKFFDPEEDYMDAVSTQKIDKGMSAAEQAVAQLANEAVVELQQEKNEHEWYQDKGQGVPKPEEEEESEEEEIETGKPKKDAKSKFAQKDLEYPDLQLIVCRRGKIMPKEGEKVPHEEVIAFIDGVEGCEPCLSIRLTNVKAGEYFILYRPDFKPWHIVKRLNIVVYSKYMKRMTEAERVSLAARQKSLASLNASSVQIPQASGDLQGPKSSAPALGRGHSALSSKSKRSTRTIPTEYDEDCATEIERLEAGSFKKDFFEQMETLNYDRQIEKMKPDGKIILPEFVENLQ